MVCLGSSSCIRASTANFNMGDPVVPVSWVVLVCLKAEQVFAGSSVRVVSIG